VHALGQGATRAAIVVLGLVAACGKDHKPPEQTKPLDAATVAAVAPVDAALAVGDNQAVQDDAAFAAAVNGTRLSSYVEGSQGYYRYAYNFLPDGQFLYCSYYFSAGATGGTVEANQAGRWEPTLGYKAPGVPGYTAGKIRIRGQAFDVVMAVEMLDAKAGVATGNMAATFQDGAFTRAVDGAVGNCSAVE
jgi:hypothetical protein